MQELLEKLKSLDPVLWKEYERCMRDCKLLIDPRIAPAILQACLQTAIRSRGGWYWKMSSQPLDGTGKYVCEIVKESGWKTVWVREEGNSPAEAMLATYIEAMS